MNQYAGTARADGSGTPVCDLRSDTVTRPDAGMLAAMAAAEVGDDVFGDDPTVNRLEAVLAERIGKEAALFVPTGTQSNFCAMLAHCARGEEVIAGQGYHVVAYEAAGASVLGGMALCDRMGGHVAVDIFERYFPRGFNRAVDILSALIGAVIFLALAWAVYESAKLSVMLNLSTNLLNLPKVWFQWALCGFAVVTALGMTLRAAELALSGRDVRGTARQ